MIVYITCLSPLIFNIMLNHYMKEKVNNIYQYDVIKVQWSSKQTSISIPVNIFCKYYKMQQKFFVTVISAHFANINNHFLWNMSMWRGKWTQVFFSINEKQIVNKHIAETSTTRDAKKVSNRCPQEKIIRE